MKNNTEVICEYCSKEYNNRPLLRTEAGRGSSVYLEPPKMILQVGDNRFGRLIGCCPACGRCFEPKSEPKPLPSGNRIELLLEDVVTMGEVKTTDKIQETWRDYDKNVAEVQLENYGIIFLDQYGLPIDDFFQLEELAKSREANPKKRYAAGDICRYSFGSKNGSIAIVEIIRILDDTRGIAEIKFLDVIADDSGNSFFTYCHQTSNTMSASLKYLNVIRPGSSGDDSKTADKEIK